MIVLYLYLFLHNPYDDTYINQPYNQWCDVNEQYCCFTISICTSHAYGSSSLLPPAILHITLFNVFNVLFECVCFSNLNTHDRWFILIILPPLHSLVFFLIFLIFLFSCLELLLLLLHHHRLSFLFFFSFYFAFLLSMPSFSHVINWWFFIILWKLYMIIMKNYKNKINKLRQKSKLSHKY